jgi:hypothetical protein
MTATDLREPISIDKRWHVLHITRWDTLGHKAHDCAPLRPREFNWLLNNDEQSESNQ